MTSAPHALEPATRDPRKLRRTAWVLILVMIVGGALVNRAYQRFTAEKAADDRPAFVGRLGKEKDLRVVRQDGSQAALLDLSGKVVVLHPVSAEQPEVAARPVEVMQRLRDHYEANENVVFVSLVLDPGPPETVAGVLAKTAGGMSAELPKWWVASTEPGIVHKFVKQEFKSAVMPHQQDGRWVFDTSIVLMDRNRHIRRGVVPQERGGPPYVATFDFDQAAAWDAKGVKTGTDRTNAEELEALLVRTIDRLLEEPIEKP
jgi:hypothetical protein